MLVKGERILIKGDPRIGKTSLVKKIAWDWAKKLFVKVSIVFFVFLKLVKPGDFIEDAIIKQTHVLQGKHVTKKKLTDIFQSFGPKCLLILDGLDECALGQNSEVHKIIVGSKLINCNILLTSRPHSTRAIERYFDTIIRVKGFTRSEARKFALQIVPSQQKVEAVINFNPTGERSDRPVHKVPILLSFLCLLVREDNIDLTDDTISMGEIYFRMVQCLYKKFTLRKGIDFQMNALLQVLKSLGKIALETLLSGNQLLKRSLIIEQVGEEVFEYGLLIGEDGFSWTRDMTVDVFVTFPHRSLQEFLGSFFIVVSPDEVEKLYGSRIYSDVLSNSLILQFYFWFLEKSDELIFSFQQKRIAIKSLISYVVDQVDDGRVYFSDIVGMLPVHRNGIVLNVLVETLTDCRKMKHLKMDFSRDATKVLPSIGTVFKTLKSIEISEFNIFHHTNTTQPINELVTVDNSRGYGANDFNIVMSIKNIESDLKILSMILKYCNKWTRNPFMYIAFDKTAHLELTRIINESMVGLHLVGN